MTLRRAHEDAVLTSEETAMIRQALAACSTAAHLGRAARQPATRRQSLAEAAEAAGRGRSPGGLAYRRQPRHRLPRLRPGRQEPAVTAAVPAPPPLDAGLEQLLRRMRLPHMRRIAPEVLATAKAQRWDPAEVLRALLAEEVAGRDRSALATRRARAAFPTGKTFDAWDERLSSIPAPTQAALRTLEWIGRHENLVVCGPSGTGKTFLLEALGQAAVEAGKHVAWFTLEQLGVLVRAPPRRRLGHQGHQPGSCAPTWSWSTTSGCCPVGPDAAEGLYRLVDAAYEKRSVAVSSNLHPSASTS